MGGRPTIRESILARMREGGWWSPHELEVDIGKRRVPRTFREMQHEPGLDFERRTYTPHKGAPYYVYRLRREA